MYTILENTTESDFCLQLRALYAEASILKELGMDRQALQVQKKADDLQNASSTNCIYLMN